MCAGAVVPLMFLHESDQQPEGPSRTRSSMSRTLQQGTALRSAPLLGSVCTWHKVGGEELSPSRANLPQVPVLSGPQRGNRQHDSDFLLDMLSYSCSTPSSREWGEEGGTSHDDFTSSTRVGWCPADPCETPCRACGPLGTLPGSEHALPSHCPRLSHL